MSEYIELGSAPADEDCVQVKSGGDYVEAMKKECGRFLELIREKMGQEPEGAKLAVKRFSHDFGPYFEVVCYYDENKEQSVEYAFECEANLPTRWVKE